MQSCASWSKTSTMKSGCFAATVRGAACIRISWSPIHARETAAASPSGRDSRLTYAREILSVARLYSNAWPTTKPRAFDGRPHDCQLRHYETLAGKLIFRKPGLGFERTSHRRWTPKHKISKTTPCKVEWAPARSAQTACVRDRDDPSSRPGAISSCASSSAAADWRVVASAPAVDAAAASAWRRPARAARRSAAAAAQPAAGLRRAPAGH